MDPYRHSPLEDNPAGDTFRLLTILPGIGDQPLGCVLEHVALRESPKYEALSYDRGDVQETVDLVCDGRALPVVVTLYSALRRVRLPSNPRRLWIDAICINQGDNDERGRQVRRMKDIYPKAERLLVWLGEADDETCSAIEMACSLARCYSEYVAEGGSLDDNYFNVRRIRLISQFFIGQQHRLDEFVKVCLRPWFSNVWAVQEVALAGDITLLCGSASMSWPELMAAITAQDRLGRHLRRREPNHHITLLQRTREEWQSGVQVEVELLCILFRYRIFGSADSRDKLFSLSNLIQSNLSDDHPALQVDYNKDATQLYYEVAKTIISESSDLSILSVPRRFCGTGPAGLPSWVPDWTNTRCAAWLGATTYSDINEQRFAASRTSKPKIQFDDTTSSLRIEAHLLDRISAIGPILKEDELPRTDFRQFSIPKCSYVLDDWSRVVGLDHQGKDNNKNPPYVTGEPLRDAFARTLVVESATAEPIETLRAQLEILEKNAAVARFINSVPHYDAQSFLVELAVTHMRSALFPSSSGGVGRQEANLAPGLEARHLASLADRRVFRTARGWIGLAPGLANVGDEVVLVRGARVPLVLRPRGEVRTLLGDCYVRGVMQGEAYSERDCIPIWIM